MVVANGGSLAQGTCYWPIHALSCDFFASVLCNLEAAYGRFSLIPSFVTSASSEKAREDSRASSAL